jgi:hypothetical protein
LFVSPESAKVHTASAVVCIPHDRMLPCVEIALMKRLDHMAEEIDNLK